MPGKRAFIAYTLGGALGKSYMRPLMLVASSGGKTHPLEKDLYLIGRQEICDLQIQHKSVSKQHCVLMRRGEKLWVRDLGSTNGSHVNGKRVRRAPLRVKDVLGVAGFAFRVRYADSKPAKSRDHATKKLNTEELRRVQLQEPATGVQPPPSSHPVVQLNSLPDEFTSVEGEE
jgi:pSer/pThr/pTyr-binding forkhead associated (FHA) protein